LRGWNDAAVVTALLFSERQRFPDFCFRHFRSFSGWPALRCVGIVRGAASRGALFARPTAAPPTTAATGRITYIEDRSLEGIHRERVAVSVRQRALGVDSLHPQNIANSA